MHEILSKRETLVFLIICSVVSFVWSLADGNQLGIVIQPLWFIYFGYRLWYASTSPEPRMGETDPKESYDFTDKWNG